VTFKSLWFFTLVACSGSGSARLIAALPKGGEGQSYTAPPPQLIYAAYIELEVFDPTVSAARASEMAESYGGYLIFTQTSRWEKETHITVVLAVPAHNFENLYRALSRLGRLKTER
jgi:hypothetical protein